MNADDLWDALRDVACTTGRKANCIVMLRKHDVEKAAVLLAERSAQTQPPANVKDLPTPTPNHDHDLAGVALKLAEESGEIAGACVKMQEGRCGVDDLDKELGDALIVLSQLAANRGTSLEDLRARRFEQIKRRAGI